MLASLTPISLPPALRNPGVRWGLLMVVILLMGFGSLGWMTLKPTAQTLPDPAMEGPLETGPEAKAVFAGGCFWGLEAMFEEIQGVKSVRTGYAGGTAGTATYNQVSRGNTDHAESVEITYDPAQVSYGELLKVFLSVGHDPTQVNRQGVDQGRQYRSAIFALTPQQYQVAQGYVQQLKDANVFDQAIATEVNEVNGVKGDQVFYPAEDYHQDFVRRNPAHPYVLVHDLPKLQAFRQQYPDLLKSAETPNAGES